MRLSNLICFYYYLFDCVIQLKQTLDFQDIYAKMKKPAFLFDGRAILDASTLREVGFDVFAIGKPDPSLTSEFY